MSHITGCSRPLDKVGLVPRQYTEWNEVGCAHSTGDHSQQGLLPEVCYTLHHQPMGAGHVTVLQLCGPMGLRVLQWCHPMLACTKRTSYCTRIITLYGARKVDSGLRTPPVVRYIADDLILAVWNSVVCSWFQFPESWS